jgi:CRP/FNR family transcriptional regulator, cyclic AMP receptor protein
MFIGSSKEGMEVAHAIQAGLKYDNVIVRPWTTDGVFGASNFPIEDLEREVAGADFGVLVLTPDDQVTARRVTRAAPRDNVAFELGMLIGGIGRARSYFVVAHGVDVKFPSDIFGMTPITYKLSTGADLAANIGPACTELRRKLAELGPK